MRFQGILAIAAAALLVAALPAPVAAQASHCRPVAPVPTLVTDAAGDQDTTPGPLVVMPPAMPHVDVRSVTAALACNDTGSGEPALELTVALGAAPTASEVLTFEFSIHKGPTSFATSKANGQTFTVAATTATVTGADGAYSTVQGQSLVLTLPWEGLRADGGDILRNLTVVASDTDPGNVAQVAQDDTTATDSAPDSGVGLDFTFGRPPLASNLVVAVTGGKAFFANNTSLGFSGAFLVMQEAPQRIIIDVRIENRGLDTDTAEVTARTDTATVSLKPGTSEIVSLSLMGPFGVGTGNITVFVKHSLPFAVGGTQPKADFTLTIGAPPASAREVIPAGLAFLTPLATGMGLDGPLGSYAELALLLLFLVLIVALLFLLATLSRPWVKAHVDNNHIVAPIGSAAHVELAIDRVRHGVQTVRAILRDAGWPATIGGRPSVDLPPDGRATLRVEIPPGVAPKDRQTIELDLVPVGEDGTETPKRAAHAKVIVQAGLPSTPLGPRYAVAGIQLVSVRHEPEQPRPGNAVTTTATVRNGGAAPAPLRVTLSVDGEPRAENRIEVPPRSSQEVPLQWVAAGGANQVKVQVFLA